ncbi:MAG: LysR family transcriptional regulator [Methylobacteriaceae bacterium]|nr:LysR family transcriptional regulator [Methylobacteriaceae bacterium]
MVIDLLALEQALRVVDAGSFRAAAARLGTEPSAISRRVRALEDRLGVSLFQRRRRGAEPTPAGRRLLSRARSILDDLDYLVRTAGLNGSAMEGSLCLGVVSSIAGGALRKLLTSFRAEFAEVDLDLIEGSPRDHIAAVGALRMDATFVVGRPPAPGCQVEALWEERIIVALPEQHRLACSHSEVTWEDLVDERFIVSKMDPGPEIQDFVVKHLATLGRHPIIEPRQVTRETLLALVGLGLGVSLVGDAEAAVRYPGVVFKPLAGELLPFHVIWSSRNDNPALRRFLSQSRAAMRRERTQTGVVSQTPDPSP